MSPSEVFIYMSAFVKQFSSRRKTTYPQRSKKKHFEQEI